MEDWIPVVALAIAIASVIYSYIRTHGTKQPTLSQVVSAGSVVPSLAERAAAAIQIAVNAVEQYRREGNYVTPDEAAKQVFDFVEEVVPEAKGLPRESLLQMLKAAVLVASNYTHQISAAKAAEKQADAPTPVVSSLKSS
jgi:hypothetical protein